MRKPLTFILLLAAIAALSAVFTSAASANAVIDDCTGSPTGELQGRYSEAALRSALKQLSGDTAEYTSCGFAIKKQLRQISSAPRDGGSDGGANGGGQDGSPSGGGGVGGDTGSGSGGGLGGGASTGDSNNSTGTSGTTGAGGSALTHGTGAGGAPATPPATAAPPPEQPGSDTPVKLAGVTVTPSIPAALGESSTTLPTALIVFLGLLGAGAIAVAGTTIGRRVLARRRS
ncbi:MAG TPA: hypothetical protein VGM91_08975 [Conexibacter sp.]|jgi:hypothetical protein